MLHLLLLSVNESRLALLMEQNTPAPIKVADEWLRTSDVRSILKCGETRIRQLIRDKAFPVSKPFGRIIYARRSDIEQFLQNGYSK